MELAPGDVADHLLQAGLAEISAAGELLMSEQATDRSTTRALAEAYRGIELVMKALVAQIHWSQVFTEPAAASLKKLAAGDFVSITLEQALTRLEGLASFTVGDAHRKHFFGMRSRRNAYEHFGRHDNVHALRGSMGAALHSLVEVLSDAEDEGILPQGADGLQTQLAQEFSRFDRFVVARMNQIRAHLKGVESFQCPACLQQAALIEDGLLCHFCQTRSTPEVAANHYVEIEMGIDAFTVHKDGGTWPVSECCSCESSSLVEFEQADKNDRVYLCFGCGEEWLAGQLDRCCDCDRLIPTSDETIICSECFQNKLDRDN